MAKRFWWKKKRLQCVSPPKCSKGWNLKIYHFYKEIYLKHTFILGFMLVYFGGVHLPFHGRWKYRTTNYHDVFLVFKGISWKLIVFIHWNSPENKRPLWKGKSSSQISIFGFHSVCKSIHLQMSNEKRAPGCSGYIGHEKLPRYVGIILNHYKDPYFKQPGWLMEHIRPFFFGRGAFPTNHFSWKKVTFETFTLQPTVKRDEAKIFSMAQKNPTLNCFVPPKWVLNPRHPDISKRKRYLDPQNIAKTPNLRRYDWVSRVNKVSWVILSQTLNVRYPCQYLRVYSKWSHGSPNISWKFSQETNKQCLILNVWCIYLHLVDFFMVNSCKFVDK